MEQRRAPATTENRIIQNLIKLRSVKAEDVMTPRVVVATAPEEMKMSDFPLNKHYLHFSRIPVYSGNMENITGFVYRQDVFENLANDRFDLVNTQVSTQKTQRAVFCQRSNTVPTEKPILTI